MLAYLSDDDALPLDDRGACAARGIGALVLAAHVEHVCAPSAEQVIEASVESVTPDAVRACMRRLIVRRRGALHVPFTADDRMADTLRRLRLTTGLRWAPEPSQSMLVRLNVAWHGRSLRRWLRIVTWLLLARYDSAMCVGAAVALVATILLGAAPPPDVGGDARVHAAWVRAAADAIDADVSDAKSLAMHGAPKHRRVLALAPLEVVCVRFRLPHSLAVVRRALDAHYGTERCVDLGAYCATMTSNEHKERCYHAGVGGAYSISCVTCALLRAWLREREL
jgi:hypothetical protein